MIGTTHAGLPVLPKSKDLLNNGFMQGRFPYPATVQSTNTENCQKAAEHMGGDDINTKVWWEKQDL